MHANKYQYITLRIDLPKKKDSHFDITLYR